MPLVRSVACHGRTILTRLFASCPPLNATNFNTTNPYQVFDRAVKRHQRDTAASKRQFNLIVDLGSGPGHFTKRLELDKVKKSIMIDSSSKKHHDSMSA